MARPGISIFDNTARSDWVRVRTLVLLRWLAVAGQSATVLVCALWLGFDLPLGLDVMVIACSVVVNLFSTFTLPANARLTERQAMWTLLFDLTQLLVLLALNGGLTNPFVLMILAPVTIAATALTRDAMFLVAGVALLGCAVLAVFYVPLETTGGQQFILPDLYLLGIWASLSVGIMFLAGYVRRVTVETFSMSQALTATQMALAREHQLTQLGGVVAAAAHEMGTPLATIKLVSGELADDLSDRPELLEDVDLIRSETDRLRQILRDMGRAGKDDQQVKTVPLSTLIQIAAEPHLDRGKEITFLTNGQTIDPGTAEGPFVPSDPEIVHGLRNLIQNAVDFAKEAVWVQSHWSNAEIFITCADDGQGYPADLIGRIGDPFLGNRSGRRKSTNGRGEYQGMGLGLFIAKTLLERSGARLTFSNAQGDGYPGIGDSPHLSGLAKATGAIVSVRWARADLEVARSAPTGPNKHISAAH